MPIEDGIKFIYKDYEMKRQRENSTHIVEKIPEYIKKLIDNLKQNISLTTFQYDQMIKYLVEQREKRAKIEFGEYSQEPKFQNLATISNASFKLDMQKRILQVLKRKPITEIDSNPGNQPNFNFELIKRNLLMNEEVQAALRVLNSSGVCSRD